MMRCSAAAAAMRDAVLVIDPHGDIRFWNAAANERFGPAAAKAAGRDAEELLKAVERQALEDRDRVLEAIAESAAMLVSAASVDAALPRALEILGEALKVQRVLVVENAPTPDNDRGLKFSYGWQSADAPMIMDDAFLSDPLVTSPEVWAWLKPLANGRPVIALGEEREGRAQPDAKGEPVQVDPVRSDLRGRTVVGHHRLRRLRGRPTLVPVRRPARCRFSPRVVAGSVVRQRHWIERQRAEEELERLSHHDALTGLANRVLFRDALEHAVARAHRGEKAFAVLYLDLDHFKDINDTLGHYAGDLLLQTVGERLVNATRETDMVARFGGDEFAVLVVDVSDPTDVGILASKIIETHQHALRSRWQRSARRRQRGGRGL